MTIQRTTKTIASQTGYTVREVNSIARDLKIPMSFNSTANSWQMDREHAIILVDHLRNLND